MGTLEATVGSEQEPDSTRGGTFGALALSVVWTGSQNWVKEALVRPWDEPMDLAPV